MCFPVSVVLMFVHSSTVMASLLLEYFAVRMIRDVASDLSANLQDDVLAGSSTGLATDLVPSLAHAVARSALWCLTVGT